jgi:hypothetical protein
MRSSPGATGASSGQGPWNLHGRPPAERKSCSPRRISGCAQWGRLASARSTRTSAWKESCAARRQGRAHGRQGAHVVDAAQGLGGPCPWPTGKPRPRPRAGSPRSTSYVTAGMSQAARRSAQALMLGAASAAASPPGDRRRTPVEQARAASSGFAARRRSRATSAPARRAPPGRARGSVCPSTTSPALSPHAPARAAAGLSVRIRGNPAEAVAVAPSRGGSGPR